MNGSGEELVKYIKSFKPGTEFNGKDLSVRFTTQNVIQCGFSIDPKCFDKENDSEFLQINRELFTPTLLVGLKFMAFFFFPQWAVEWIPVG